MSNKSNSSSVGNGIGFTGLLTIVFIILKLLGKITWSWLWVLSPIWINVGIVCIVLIIAFAIALLSEGEWYFKELLFNTRALYFAKIVAKYFGRGHFCLGFCPFYWKIFEKIIKNVAKKWPFGQKKPTFENKSGHKNGQKMIKNH